MRCKPVSVAVLLLVPVVLWSVAPSAGARPILPRDSQRLELVKVIAEQAELMTDAAVSGDYSALTDFMYPRLVTMLGGRTKTIAQMQVEMAAAGSGDYGITAIRVLHATVPVDAGGELHSIVTCHQYMRAPDSYFRSKTILVAASSDHGENWTFVAVPRRNPESVKSVFPDWNPALEIPTPSEPERLISGLALEGVVR